MIFASKIWGAYIREGLFFWGWGLGDGGLVVGETNNIIKGTIFVLKVYACPILIKISILNGLE